MEGKEMQTSVKINGTEHSIDSGLVSAQQIYNLAECEEGHLFVNRADDIDIPISSSEYLVIRGNEAFVSGDSAVENNPPLRKPVQIRFNGQEGVALKKAKVTGRELKDMDKEFPQGRLFVDIESGPDVELSDTMVILAQDGNSFFVIPAAEGTNQGDPIDVEECNQSNRPPPKGQTYRVRIDREKRKVQGAKITGTGLLALVDKNPEEWALNQKLKGGKRERIEAEDTVNVAEPGVERFETVRRQAQQGRE